VTNYKLIIKYDGTRYHGWEHQPGDEMTIQGKMETAVIRMLNPSGLDEMGEMRADCLGRFEGSIPDITSSGRTDGGVHAQAMCANVHLETSLDVNAIRKGLNRNLPDDICVTEVSVVSDRFHARYNAKGKTYRYTCYAGDLKPVFDRRYCYELGSVPDIQAMRRAAGYLIGEHDYTSFCGNPHMKKSCVRVVDRIDIEYMDDILTFTYHGTGFLQYMVRIMTGTLLEVGIQPHNALLVKVDEHMKLLPGIVQMLQQTNDLLHIVAGVVRQLNLLGNLLELHLTEGQILLDEGGERGNIAQGNDFLEMKILLPGSFQFLFQRLQFSRHGFLMIFWHKVFLPLSDCFLGINEGMGQS